MKTLVNRLCRAAAATLALSGITPAQINPSPAPHARGVIRPGRAVATPVAQTISKTVFAAPSRPNVDLRPEIDALGMPVRAQGARGTCSVFAMTFLLDYMYAKYHDMKGADFSEEFLNYASNLAINQKNDGGFFDQLDLGYQKYGMVKETVAPYLPAFNPDLAYRPALLAGGAALAPRLKPQFIKPWDVTTGLKPDHLNAVLAQLDAGRPVAAGLRWPKATPLPVETVAGVTMMKVPAAEGVFDGHSIAFVGYKKSGGFPGGGYFIFRNSWGPNFMEEGYGYMPFAYALKYTNDLVVYE